MQPVVAMDVDMDADHFVSASNAFLTWLKQTGSTISDKIELADLRQQGAGRGVGML
jgi:SET domain-containing protein 6